LHDGQPFLTHLPGFFLVVCGLPLKGGISSPGRFHKLAQASGPESPPWLPLVRLPIYFFVFGPLCKENFSLAGVLSSFPKRLAPWNFALSPPPFDADGCPSPERRFPLLASHRPFPSSEVPAFCHSFSPSNPHATSFFKLMLSPTL